MSATESMRKMAADIAADLTSFKLIQATDAPIAEGVILRALVKAEGADAAKAVAEPKTENTAPGIIAGETANLLGTAVIHADGACSGNPGPAGAGWIIRDSEAPDRPLVEGRAPLGRGTNQMAEILAAAMALEALPEDAGAVVHTDSQYVIGTMTENWKRKANNEHWDRLDAAVARLGFVQWIKVKGHSGDKWNERADALATRAAAECK